MPCDAVLPALARIDEAVGEPGTHRRRFGRPTRPHRRLIGPSGSIHRSTGSPLLSFGLFERGDRGRRTRASRIRAPTSSADGRRRRARTTTADRSPEFANTSPAATPIRSTTPFGFGHPSTATPRRSSSTSFDHSRPRWPPTSTSAGGRSARRLPSCSFDSTATTWFAGP